MPAAPSRPPTSDTPTRRSRRLARARARAAAREAAATLTAREVQVLQAVVDRAGIAGAAAVLGLAESTVAKALERMRSKCRVDTTPQLVLLAASRLTPSHVTNGPMKNQA